MSDKNLVNNLKIYLNDIFRTNQVRQATVSTQAKINDMCEKINDFISENDVGITAKLEMKDIIDRMRHTSQRLDEIEKDTEELKIRVCKINKN